MSVTHSTHATRRAHAAVSPSGADTVKPSTAAKQEVPARATAHGRTSYEKRGDTAGLKELAPPTSKKASVPLGAWALKQGAAAPGSVVAQNKAFAQMLQSPAPDRSRLVDAAIQRRMASQHAYYRGVADARTQVLAKELPAANYPGKSGFVLSTGDMHLYQPGTVTHPTHGIMVGVGDSDRVGFGPYEWDVRSLATSVELEGRVKKLPVAVREKAMTAMLEAYRDSVKDVANAKDPEKMAKSLRLTQDSAPSVFRDLLARAGEAGRKAFLEERIVMAPSPRLRREAGVLEDIPDKPAGVRARVANALRAALPEYLKTLPEDARKALDGFQVVDVAVPFKGNGSLGYGRYRVLLEPRDGAKKPGDMVILEFKEQLPSAIGKHVDQKQTRGLGQDQATRAVNLFRLGTGMGLVQTWGHVELPKGCGVTSNTFTVKDVREDEKGVDLAGCSEKEFVEMARAQGRLLASFQTLGGVNGAAQGVGGARDILLDIKNRPDWAQENLDGARGLADRFSAAASAFAKSHA